MFTWKITLHCRYGKKKFICVKKNFETIFLSNENFIMNICKLTKAERYKLKECHTVTIVWMIVLAIKAGREFIVEQILRFWATATGKRGGKVSSHTYIYICVCMNVYMDV